MGGVVSAGVDNDELVDKLKGADYIKSTNVEKVFRLVDRGYYLTKENLNSAYSDNAWRSGNLHISAPCIYAQVMEGLQIGPRMSFLNLGSGTGYLSTMAGLMLGPGGTNHGVEIYGDVVDYAKERLAWFYNNSGAIDVAMFCEPQFFQGNALCLSEDIMTYDRVYCGASCPASHENYMKNLLKVTGVLVMPRNDQLLKITRTGKEVWITESLLPVSFSSLIVPDKSLAQNNVQLPLIIISSLQEMSRNAIRNELRMCAEKENVDLDKSFVHAIPVNTSRRQSDYCRVRRIFPDMVFSDPDEESDEELGIDDRDGLYDAQRQTASQISAFLDLARSLAMNRNSSDNPNEMAVPDEDFPMEDREIQPLIEDSLENLNSNALPTANSDVSENAQMEEDKLIISDSKELLADKGSKNKKLYDLLTNNHVGSITNLSNNAKEIDNDAGTSHEVSVNNSECKEESMSSSGNINDTIDFDDPLELDDKMVEDWIDGKLKDWGCLDKTEKYNTKIASKLNTSNLPSDDAEVSYDGNDVPSSHPEVTSNYNTEGETSNDVQMPSNSKIRDSCKINSMKCPFRRSSPDRSENQEKLNKKREKFDSGISEDMDVQGHNDDDQCSISSSTSSALSCSVPSSSSTESEDSENTFSNAVHLIQFQCNCSDGCDSCNENKCKARQAKRKRNHMPTRRMKRETKENGSEERIHKYTTLMREKIQQLPLPPPLKSYLNYYRPL